MNLLIVRRSGDAQSLVEAALSKQRMGLHCSDYVEHSDNDGFRYAMRNLSWTKTPGPNAIAYIATAILGDALDLEVLEERLVVLSNLAVRDACTFFVVVPPLATAEQEELCRKLEAWILGRVPTAFILHRANPDEAPELLANLLLKLVESGMFGRYEVVKGRRKDLELRPLLKRTPLFRPAPPEIPA